MKRILVDFNSMNVDAQNRVYVGGLDSARDDQDKLSALRAGDLVILDSGDLEVQATLEYDETLHAWFGHPDWATRCDLEADDPAPSAPVLARDG